MNQFKANDRVELHPATSEWMAGDRFGTVVGYGHTREYRVTSTQTVVKARPVRVKLDKSGRIRRFHPDNLSLVQD